MQEEEQLILRHELLGDEELFTCALCQHVLPKHEARTVRGDEIGTTDVEFVLVCRECWRELRGRDHVLPPPG
jgi:hypothetical protein